MILEKTLDTDSKSLKVIRHLSAKTKELYEEIKKEKNDTDPEKFVCVKTDGTIFNFNKFKNSLDLASNIYRDKNLLKDMSNEQYDIKILLNKLRNYNPTKPKKKFLIKTGIFLYIDGFKKKKRIRRKKVRKNKR